MLAARRCETRYIVILLTGSERWPLPYRGYLWCRTPTEERAVGELLHDLGRSCPTSQCRPSCPRAARASAPPCDPLGSARTPTPCRSLAVRTSHPSPASADRSTG